MARDAWDLERSTENGSSGIPRLLMADDLYPPGMLTAAQRAAFDAAWLDPHQPGLIEALLTVLGCDQHGCTAPGLTYETTFALRGWILMHTDGAVVPHDERDLAIERMVTL